MNDEDFKQWRADVVSAMNNRTPNTVNLPLLRLAERVDPKDRPAVYEILRLYANPEEAFECPEYDDPDFLTAFAGMALYTTLRNHFNWKVESHEAPVLNLGQECLDREHDSPIGMD